MTKKKNDLQQDQPDKHDIPAGKSGANSFTIVGIGASAGALKACEGFFTNLPPDSGAAFVIVIHLDPSHSSIFVELLQKYTQMPVFEAVNGMTVEPNCVYTIPPKADIAIQHGKLQLLEPSRPRGVHLAIDLFFRSLAEDQGESAVCIILSGTGTDGTSGLRAVKAELGMVMVQDPATAEFDAMPKSAADTGLADYVLPVEQLPAQLLAYMKGSYQMKNAEAPAVRDSGRDSLGEVLDILRIQTGHDFSLYKRGTIGRRIERRMNVNQVASITEYVHFLQNNPGETQILFRELLINVTSFFRDPEVFAILKEQTLPELLAGKPENYTVRVWAPGCATGEEVYSLAIVLRECMDDLKREFRVQIFGTDLDEDAIATARRGVYPLNINADISPERLSSFFITEDESYKIRKDIRDAAVFATHDVAKDPPFAKLDLICCRNLLIYLEVPLQKRLLSLFHHLLQPGGILLLGSAETLGELADYFTVVDQKWRIFQRKESQDLPRATDVYPIISSSPGTGPGASRFHAPEAGRLNIPQVLEKELLEKYAPPSVVINDKAEVVYVHGRTGKYLEPAPGQPPWNVFDMAREGLRYELKSAIQEATAVQAEVVRDRVLVVSDSSAEFVKLTVRPITGSRSLEGLLLVMFESQGPLESQTRDAKPEQASTTEPTSLLEQELSQTRQLLQATVRDMEASYQEVASTNEELLSTNEELQSSNEELETSKEEMQSLYEELVTVNSELRIKIDELSQSNSDLNNFLNSTEIAAVFLDNELKIRRFTPLATQMFNLLPVDVGRPLEHIASNLAEVSVIEDARGILSTLELSHKEVRTKQGIWHMMRILPYRTEKNVVEGVVITFTDINEQKTALAQVERKIAEATEFNQQLLESSPLGIITYNSSGQVAYVNDASADIFGGRKEQILQPKFNNLEPWKQQGTLDIAKQVLETGIARQLQVHIQSIFGKNVWLDLKFSRFTSGGEPHLLMIYDDITDRKLMDDALRLSEERFSKAFHSGPTIGVIRSLDDHRIIDVNDNFVKTMGYKKEEVLGQAPAELLYWADRESFEQVYRDLERKSELKDVEVKLLTKSGKIIKALFYAFTTEIDGRPCALVNIVDITERKRMEDALLRSRKNQLMLIMDTIPSIMTHANSENHYQFVNKAYEDWYGVNKDAVLGRPVQEVIGEQTYHKLQAYIEAVLSGEKVVYENEMPGKDGGKHYFYTVMVPEIDDQGTVKGYFSLSTDMTEFRSMEQENAEALEFNQTIVESSPIGIGTFDYSGQLVFINDAGARMSGGTKKLVLQQNINFNQLDTWKQTGLQDVARHVLTTGIPSNIQTYLKTVFGKDVWADFRFSRFNSGGEPHLLMVYEDITERKLAEEQNSKLNSDLIKRTYELTNINKELESFSYSISHDLRAPLRAINGFSQIISNEYKDKLDDEGKEYLQIVRSECNRMSDLINGILQLSRLSRKELKREDLDLSTIAETIAAELSKLEPERQVDFAITPGIKAYGDRVLLQSVLQNLLDNAWKFTSKHPKARIEFGVTDRDGSKAYFVRDDGAGFDMKYAGKLFGIFQRLHGVDDFPGDGIGLAIVQRIINHHGGKAWAEGAVEKGAAFYFTLHDRSEGES